MARAALAALGGRFTSLPDEESGETDLNASGLFWRSRPKA